MVCPCVSDWWEERGLRETERERTVEVGSGRSSSLSLLSCHLPCLSVTQTHRSSNPFETSREEKTV